MSRWNISISAIADFNLACHFCVSLLLQDPELAHYRITRRLGTQQKNSNTLIVALGSQLTQTVVKVQITSNKQHSDIRDSTPQPFLPSPCHPSLSPQLQYLTNIAAPFIISTASYLLLLRFRTTPTPHYFLLSQ